MALSKNLLNKLNNESDLLSIMLTGVIEEAIECAVLHVSGESLENKKYVDISFGENKITQNRVITADDSNGKGIIVEFSKDFSEAWIPQMKHKKIKLSETTKEIVTALFKKLEGFYESTVKEMSKISVAKMACEKFTKELRYGTQEQLIKEYYEVFDETLSEMTSMIDDEDQLYLANRTGLFNRPEITDIITFLKENNEDIFNIHVINDNYKLD